MPIVTGPGPANAAILGVYYNRIRTALPVGIITATVLVDEGTLANDKREAETIRGKLKVRWQPATLANTTAFWGFDLAHGRAVVVAGRGRNIRWTDPAPARQTLAKHYEAR